VSIIPQEMKDEIINNIKYLREDEVDRLKAELFKESSQEEFDKFIRFSKILDNQRKNKMSEFLPEWSKYGL
jgi:hypothetical protein